MKPSKLIEWVVGSGRCLFDSEDGVESLLAFGLRTLKMREKPDCLVLNENEREAVMSFVKS